MFNVTDIDICVCVVWQSWRIMRNYWIYRLCLQNSLMEIKWQFILMLLYIVCHVGIRIQCKQLTCLRCIMVGLTPWSRLICGRKQQSDFSLSALHQAWPNEKEMAEVADHVTNETYSGMFTLCYCIVHLSQFG